MEISASCMSCETIKTYIYAMVSVWIILAYIPYKNWFGSGGIRTHASEETGALNQRLRPLGHATLMRISPLNIPSDATK